MPAALDEWCRRSTMRDRGDGSQRRIGVRYGRAREGPAAATTSRRGDRRRARSERIRGVERGNGACCLADADTRSGSGVHNDDPDPGKDDHHSSDDDSEAGRGASREDPHHDAHDLPDVEAGHRHGLEARLEAGEEAGGQDKAAGDSHTEAQSSEAASDDEAGSPTSAGDSRSGGCRRDRQQWREGRTHAADRRSAGAPRDLAGADTLRRHPLGDRSRESSGHQDRLRGSGALRLRRLPDRAAAE